MWMVNCVSLVFNGQQQALRFWRDQKPRISREIGGLFWVCRINYNLQEGPPLLSKVCLEVGLKIKVGIMIDRTN